jgi:23S rRNA (guanosine2251-2'-O)-methyltransferase
MARPSQAELGRSGYRTRRKETRMTETRLIHGFHAVIAKLRHAPEDVKEIYVAEGRQDGRVRDLVKAAEAAGARVLVTDAARLDGMAGGGRHQGVMAKVAAAQKHLTLDDVLETLSGPALLLVLDGVQDPHNLGACLRVADAAGADAVIAPKDRACGLNATAIKVASGAADTVPYITVTNLARSLRELQERDIWVVGAAGEATKDLYAIDQTGPLAWVLGAEGAGLRRLTRDTCDELARIPMAGTVESLNVSVASGICLFEARRQRR